MAQKKITLDDHYLYNGTTYGPGEVEVDEEIAKFLKSGMERKIKIDSETKKRDQEAIDSTRGTTKANNAINGVSPHTGGGSGMDSESVQEMIDAALRQRDAEWELKLTPGNTGANDTNSTENKGTPAENGGETPPKP